MNYDIDKIKADNDIVVVARRLGIEIEGEGSNRVKARCFRPQNHSHGDRTASAMIDREKQIFRCWVCDEKHLDVIDLVMAIVGCDLKEACKYLGGEETIPVIPNGTVERKRREMPVANFVDLEVLNFFMSLCDPDASEMIQYFKGREISENTLRLMKIRFCRDYNDVNSKMKSRFSVDRLRGAGFISQNNEKGNIMPFGRRAIYPFYSNKKIVYLQGRAIDKDERLPKLSLAGVIPCLYNVDTLHCKKEERGTVILCEGCEDALTGIEMGKKAVAILGVNNFKASWVKYFRGWNVQVVLDNDTAGRGATEAIGKLLKKNRVKWADVGRKFPKGYDLNDWHKEKIRRGQNVEE